MVTDNIVHYFSFITVLAMQCRNESAFS